MRSERWDSVGSCRPTPDLLRVNAPCHLTRIPSISGPLWIRERAALICVGGSEAGGGPARLHLVHPAYGALYGRQTQSRSTATDHARWFTCLMQFASPETEARQRLQPRERENNVAAQNRQPCLPTRSGSLREARARSAVQPAGAADISCDAPPEKCAAAAGSRRTPSLPLASGRLAKTGCRRLPAAARANRPSAGGHPLPHRSGQRQLRQPVRSDQEAEGRGGHGERPGLATCFLSSSPFLAAAAAPPPLGSSIT